MKAEPNRLIPLKPIENLLELLIVILVLVEHFQCKANNRKYKFYN